MEKKKTQKHTRTKNITKFLVKLAISATALYVVLRKINIKEIIELYKQSDLLLLFPAIILFIVSKIVSAYRLNLLFQRIGVRMNARTNLKLYWLGMYYNLFLPGGIGGDGYKIYFLKKHYFKRVKNIVAAIFIDRANGIFVLLLISCLFFSIPIQVEWLESLLLLIIPIGYLIYYVLMHYWFSIFKKVMHRINLYSLAVQLFQIAMVILILHSWDVNNDLLIYLSVFLISSVIAILPITIGGAGARELTFLFFSGYFSFELNTAVALSLMFYLITLLVSFGGIFYSMKPIKLDHSQKEKQYSYPAV